MKNKYKLMNGKKLADFVLSKDYDEEYYFAADYPEEGINEDNQHDISGWYGIKRSKQFDADVVMVGYMGGGSCMMFDIGEAGEYLADDLERYIEHIINEGVPIEGLVCVQLENEDERS